MQTQLDSSQIKNRIKALKTETAEYREIVAEKATGNNKKTNYPLYWDTMLENFQVNENVRYVSRMELTWLRTVLDWRQMPS